MSTSIINKNLYGSLSNQQLTQFEEKYRVNFPNDYRNFLLQYNGGKPVPSFFWIKSQEDGSNVLQFYGLHDGPKPFSIETYMNEKQVGLPDSLMPIGDDGTGNFICMNISLDNVGKIFLLIMKYIPLKIQARWMELQKLPILSLNFYFPWVKAQNDYLGFVGQIQSQHNSNTMEVEISKHTDE